MKSRPFASRLDPAAETNSRHGDSASFRIYPFSMIVGQEEMKRALILNVIDPLIGGVLLMGHRGTAKSTAVRAMANLLAEIWTVRGCDYQCDPAGDLCGECTRRLVLSEKLTRQRMSVPIVDLPLGATEDRVCGTIDIERALKDGVKSFEPGLLARANRGFLYIDEVNLLEDHLVDLLLDVAATGRNKVERESISVEHPARFVLIGSGNPEEGELRPQLLDRFGLHVEVKTEDDLDRRVEIVERREEFENNPAEFCARVGADQQQLRNKIARAQKSARTVKVNRTLLRQIAQLCTQLKIDGHRGELTIVRSARSLAAFEGRRKVTEEDVRRVAVMSLRHRLRRDPLEETAGTNQIRQALAKVFPEQQNSRGGGRGTNGGSDGFDKGGKNHVRARRGDVARAHHQSAVSSSDRGADSPKEPSQPSALDVVLPKLSDNDQRRTEPRRPRSDRVSGSGPHKTRSGVWRTSINYQRGRYSGAVSSRKGEARVAIDATLRALASAGYQVSGASHNFLPAPSTRHPTPVPTPDTRHRAAVHTLRYKQLASKRGTLFILLIDASGSMALNRISQAKGAALNLLKDSYIKRDRVAIVGCRGTAAEVLLPPSKSMLRARRVLDSLGVGGGTPLSAGLLCSLKLAKRAQPSGGEIVLLIFTDGHANVSLRSDHNGNRALRRQVMEQEIAGLGMELTKAGVKMILVDTQNGFVSNGNTRELADRLGGSYVTSRKLLTAVAGSANH